MTNLMRFGTTVERDAQTETLTVVVVGEFESATVAEFELVASQAFERGSEGVALDLAETTLIDSAAIGAIMRFRRHLRDLGVELSVNAPSDYQQRLFKIVGLSHVLSDAPDR